ncbi:class I SAM-dependent methyltransferase [Phenylobacterium montanum]|uniref:Methyltransferase domain-containing protein n=1 Tax=Phenylobacterium montanum TaxID=2823693 RepID=A0A975IXT0_9CAUL|nr:class I SAM-dependent methyltransferase [Caulobacter sp. S6]QUD89731.1 methyltransferase domain-containing protein [Caulobacter sp. S6]
MADGKAGPMAHHAHSHFWIFGLVGLAAGAALMIYVPHLKAVSASLILFAGFHLVGAVVILSSLYFGGLRDHFRRARKNRAASGDRLDFGWGPGWMNGLGIAALIALAAAVAVQVSAPGLWPLAFALVALACLFLAGNSIMRGFRRQDQAVLPMVDLLRGEADVVMDAGCGAGRTSIALGRIVRGGHIIAVDRFDAGYIDDGGRALLERNLQLAGLSDKVTIESGDLTALPFGEGDFDSIASTHVYDHLGDGKAKGLAEAFRVLKPGGRFLMAIWVPGMSMFAVANVLSMFLTPKSAWRAMAKAAGFEIVEEGAFNHAWYLLLQKPGPRGAAA